MQYVQNGRLHDTAEDDNGDRYEFGGVSYAAGDQVSWTTGMRAGRAYSGIEDILRELAAGRNIGLRGLLVSSGLTAKSYSFILEGRAEDVYGFGQNLRERFGG